MLTEKCQIILAESGKEINRRNILVPPPPTYYFVNIYETH
jgi:hypothetical protein